MEKPAARMAVFSGGVVDILDPQPDTIKLIDIAVALSRIPRYNGHTMFHYSVAQHSLLAESLAEPDADPNLRLLILLHDAHEAYLGDPTSPLLRAIQYLEQLLNGYGGNAIQTLREKFDIVIFSRFGLTNIPSKWQAEVTRCDRLAAAIEMAVLLRDPNQDFGISLPAVPDQISATVSMFLDEMQEEDVIRHFITRVKDLIWLRHGIVSA